eukprot:scaffold3951_cov69-Cyclotella_meneghiniana.AAC.24
MAASLVLLVLVCGIQTTYAFQVSHSSAGLGFDQLPMCRRPCFALNSSGDGAVTKDHANVNFDIAVNGEDIGRLLFHLIPPSNQNYLPIHTSNFLSLVSSSRTAIDPKATYKGCQFQYSPSSIEDGSMRYRWGHVCDGPAIQQREHSRDDANLSLLRCKQSCYGGAYYGTPYAEILDMINEQSTMMQSDDKEAVLLTVPTTLSARFSIVRVSESPKEWGERLLINTAVLGYLNCECLDTLRVMARQRFGVPTITDCGVLNCE